MLIFTRIFAALGVFLVTQSPLTFAHGPDQPRHQIANLGELKLEHGGVIPSLKMSYVTNG